MQVLDKGSLDIVGSMGSDKTVVDCARISFNNDNWGDTNITELSAKDAKLIHYLADNGHNSVFYHPQVMFRVKSPISVRDQWSTHKAGTALNSSSTRYTEVKREFYIPKEFRKQSTSNRQGSEGALDEGPAYLAQRVYESACNSAFDEYEYMIKLGVAKELAREVLPLCTYTTFVFTMSLMAVTHFIKLRTEEHAQEEIKMYALAMKELVKPLFPVSMKALLG